MPKTLPAWPAELRRPIYLGELPVARGLFFSTSDSKADRESRLHEAVGTALNARLESLSTFFGLTKAPDADTEWITLLISLSNHCGLPIFKIEAGRRRGPGASKKWTDEKLCELFADVQSLVAHSAMTEHAACKHIAANPGKFARRYSRPNRTKPGNWSRTLHRQFTTAKKRAKDDFAFKMIFFGEGPGLLRPVPEWPRLLQVAIERYAVARI